MLRLVLVSPPKGNGSKQQLTSCAAANPPRYRAPTGAKRMELLTYVQSMAVFHCSLRGKSSSSTSGSSLFAFVAVIHT